MVELPGSAATPGRSGVGAQGSLFAARAQVNRDPLPLGENGACSVKEGPSGARPLLGWMPMIETDQRQARARGSRQRYLHEEVGPGSLIEASAPRGSFILGSGETPVALMSAGIWATPVMAMLHARPGEEFSASVKIAARAGAAPARGAPHSRQGDRFSSGRNQKG